MKIITGHNKDIMSNSCRFWSFTRLILGISCLGLMSVTTAMTTSAETAITAIEIANSLNNPIFVTAPLDDPNRLFIVEQGGRILINRSDSILTRPFLDVNSLTASGGERGLLGMAFELDYMTSGRFYINYTDNSGNSVVKRYIVSADPDSADVGSGEIIMTIPQPYSNHNGGMVAINPVNGFLYIGTGDGGSGGDPGNRAQNPVSLLGKMLRIDVSGTGPGYLIPVDNPYVGSVDTLPEIWSLGMRNPWRYSLDRANGDLYIADVGQGEIEEIDFEEINSTGGLNYGWRLKEGSSCYNPSTGCDPGGLLVDPIHEYSHGGSPFRCSITGGYVYRGCAIPDLSGNYFFADYCSGQVWSFRYDGSVITNFQDRTSELGIPSMNISSFGQDSFGEIYIVSNTQGAVYKIVPDGVPSACACCIIPGDFNDDLTVDISDLTDTVDFMFRGGLEPDCYDHADVNADCVTDISDLTYRVDFMFRGGSPLSCGCVGF